MLTIYPVTLLLARDAALAADRIGRRDPDLARQLRRAAASVPLNTAEGYGSTGGNKRARYTNALASAYEVRACFDTAVAMRYLPDPTLDTRDRIERIIATLIKLSR